MRILFKYDPTQTSAVGLPNAFRGDDAVGLKFDALWVSLHVAQAMAFDILLSALRSSDLGRTDSRDRQSATRFTPDPVSLLSAPVPAESVWATAIASPAAIDES